jgi:formiminotetrahydrofolate cyclodeaminase
LCNDPIERLTSAQPEFSSIAGVTGVAELPLGRFLEEVAEAKPAPGGGSSAALACGLAAALVEMAASLSRKGGSRDAAGRARDLRRCALDLAERELSSYEPVLAAMRLPDDDPARGPALETALSDASGPPLAIAEAAAKTAALGVEVARASSASVRGDALTGTVLAEGAAAAAASLVEINLAERAGDASLDRAREARRRACVARSEALRLVAT